MKRAGGDAVEALNILAGNGAEAIDVEVGVLGFERIEGPFDETDVAPESVFTLSQFEMTADAAIAMGRKHTGHVRVEVGRGAVEADVSLGEAHQKVTVVGAENLATSMIGDNEGDVRLGVEFRVTPDFAGDLHAALKVGQGVKRADSDV